MPLTEQELLERDAKRDIGEELLQAILDVKAGHYGAVYEVEPGPVVSALSGASSPVSQSNKEDLPAINLQRLLQCAKELNANIQAVRDCLDTADLGTKDIIRSNLGHLEAELEAVASRIKKHIDSNPELRGRTDLLANLDSRYIPNTSRQVAA